jgi:hypothetical protein
MSTPSADNAVETAWAVETSWAEIEQLTSALKNAAANADWEQVLTLAANRHCQVQSHFTQFPVSSDTAAFYQPRLTQLLRGERELQQLAGSARREVLREGLASNRNHRAVGAYLNS